MVEQHAGLIKRIAQHLAARLPATVELADLMQAGAIGLLESAHRFDPGQGASFATYASIRIRGAMLDELRRYDWSPRSTRKKIRQMTQAIREIEGHKGSGASESEVAEAMGMTAAEYRGLLQDSVSCSLFSLDHVVDRRGDAAIPHTAHRDDPLHHAEKDELQAELKEVIKTLPEREQLILALYYDQECNLKEIGEILNVSESRVCQIHGQTLARVRARMPHRED